MTAKNIIHFVSLGVGATIDCRSFSFIDLKALAKAAKESGAKVTLSHICFSEESLDEVVAECPAQFCLDLTHESLED